MKIQYGVVRLDAITALHQEKISRAAEVVFETERIVEAAFHRSRLSDLAPPNVAYRVVRLSIRGTNQAPAQS